MAMPQPQYQQPAPQPVKPPPYYYAPQPGSPAAELLSQLDEAKAAYEEAKARAEGLVKAVEAAVTADTAAQLNQVGITTLPGEIRISGSPFWQGRVLRWKIPRKFNRKRFAHDYPQLEPLYVEDGDGYWQLDPVK